MASSLISSPTEIPHEVFVHLSPADLRALDLTHRSVCPHIETLLYSRSNGLGPTLRLPRFLSSCSVDPRGKSPWKSSSSGPLNGTFDGEHDFMAQITLFVDPSASLAEKDKIQDNATSAGVNQAIVNM